MSPKRIEVIGHSGFDEIGRDIVCSAVSSIITTSINGILSINDDAVCYRYRKAVLVIEVKSDDQITRKLLDNMVYLIKDLAKDYPENVKVKEF